MADVRPALATQTLKPPLFYGAVLRLLTERWTEGSLNVVLPDGAQMQIAGPLEGPHAELRIRSYGLLRRVIGSGDIGFAESYMAGEWDTPNLTDLLVAFALNFDRLAGLVRGAPLRRMIDVVRHALRRNTRNGSRRNIEAHYDLGEAFYAAWLDPSMTYSAALYADGESLQAAQRNKYTALAEMIGLSAGQSVLEIGCGWGGFAEFAAGEIGAKVTAVTISRDQHDYARRRLSQQGLNERAEIRLMDYRDIQGTFDRVVSIEMFEAVGEAYWSTYFAKVRASLKSGGQAGLQIITIRDDLYDDYARQTDFIQKYVFPGGALPSEQRVAAVTREVGLSLTAVRRFGADYARTLSDWTTRFEGAWSDVSRLGFDERFRRLWRFYLAYCEAGFATGRTDVIQCALRLA